MEYVTINQAGRQALISWLESNLKEPEYAERHASVVVNEFDGSRESHDYELRGRYSKDGNPKIYHFTGAELDREVIEEG